METYIPLEICTPAQNVIGDYNACVGVNFVALQDQLEYQSFDDHFEIDPDCLQIIELLGEGRFADVHLGILKQRNSNQQMLVAVKTPKRENHSEKPEEHDKRLQRQRASLRDELKVMSFIGTHENVLQLIGAITTNKDDFCVITEYCGFGSLDIFLRTAIENDLFCDEIEKIDCDGGVASNKSCWKCEKDANWLSNFESRRKIGLITTSDLLWFALQIASAMNFLVRSRVLHRDAALRNVLLKDNFVVKVADFGLSRFADNDGSYCMLSSFDMPFRYIAPESLATKCFSYESEFWTFGVTLWELFTFSKRPPYVLECDNTNDYQVILSFLQSGRRLTIPDCAPLAIRILMGKLWNIDPKTRPTFESCQKILIDELMQACPQILKGTSFKAHPAVILTTEVSWSHPSDVVKQVKKNGLNFSAASSKKLLALVVFCLLVTLVTAVFLTFLTYFFIVPIVVRQFTFTGIVRSHFFRGIPGTSFCLNPADNNSIFTFNGLDFVHVDLKSENHTVLEKTDPKEFTRRNVRSNSMHAIVRRSNTFILLLLLENDSLKVLLTSYRIHDKNISLVHEHDLDVEQMPTEWFGLAYSIVEDSHTRQLYCVIFNDPSAAYEPIDAKIILTVVRITVGVYGKISSEILARNKEIKGRWLWPFVRLGSMYLLDMLGARQEEFIRLSLNGTELSYIQKPANRTTTINNDNLKSVFDTSISANNQRWPQWKTEFFMPFFPVTRYLGDYIYFTFDVTKKPGSLVVNFVNWKKNEWETVVIALRQPGRFLVRTHGHGILETQAKCTSNGRLIIHGNCYGHSCTAESYFYIVNIEDAIKFSNENSLQEVNNEILPSPPNEIYGVNKVGPNGPV